MIGRSSLAQGRSNCKNDENSIDEHKHDSWNSWSFWHEFCKTDLQQGMWSMDPRRIVPIDEYSMKNS